MSDKKDLLKEWYDTARVGDREEVMVSRMPDAFQQMRTAVPECPPTPPQEPPVQTEPEKSVEVEIQVDKEQDQHVPMEVRSLQDVYVKTGVFLDTVHQYRDAVQRGDEAMQTEFIKERLKNLSIEIMRLVDGIWRGNA